MANGSADSCFGRCSNDIVNIDEEEDVGDEFYFESDELALKGNADYLGLLRTVAVLEAQRIKSIKDFDRLVECEKHALANPIEFVEKLRQQNESNALNLPGLQQIATLPIIDWDKYVKRFNSISLTNTGLQLSGGTNLAHRRHMTRQNRKKATSRSINRFETGADQAGSAPPSLEGIHSNSDETADFSTNVDSNQAIIRGRLCNLDVKPQTFNQLWTVEEQKRLEDLLVKFPPEEIEARRWGKIATALGNRTAQQVASRVQKYFIKLTKAGLPVPGRIPNLASYSRRPFSQNGNHKQHRHNRFLFGASTFLASYEPPVFMSDMDDDASGSSSNFLANGMADDIDWTEGESGDGDDDDDNAISTDLRQTDEYKELMLLKQMKRRKMRDEGTGEHFGYRCDRCNCDPIIGSRWHCVTCPTDVAVDLCEICVDSEFENGIHDSSHIMERIRISHIDGDYTPSTFRHGDYNYLDPNYMPAN